MDDFKPEQISPAPSKRKPGCGMLFLIVAAVIILAGVVGAMFGSGSMKTAYDPNWSGEAISQCEDLVKENLKAPSTAKFDTTATGDGTWIVSGTVDSENSFGATLRAEFQCTVIVEGESIKRRLDYLE